MPPIPEYSPKEEDSLKRHLTFLRKKYSRTELLDRCGLRRNDQRKDLRICTDHEYEPLTKRVHLEHNRKKREILIVLSVPKPYTSSSIISTQQSRKTVNKGVGRDRMMRRLLGNITVVQDEYNNTSTPDVTGWAMEC